jgi:cytochrome c oxidase assembly protein subunit 11
MANELAVDERARENRRLFTRLLIVAVGMFGFGYAMVPFYRAFCEAIGINSLVQRDAAPSNTQVDATRTVTVEFDSNVRDLPWRFRPVVGYMQVHPGQLTHVEYEVSNLRQTAVTGQAIASFGPQIAGRYFRKLECFCFSQQTLAAGETRRMPVTFVVDAQLPAEINTITLSYTFFEVPGTGSKG